MHILLFQEIESLLVECFRVIGGGETFLVAKCCHLVRSLVERQGLLFSQPTLGLFVDWVTSALESSADVAYIDILQAIDIVIKENNAQLYSVSVIISVSNTLIFVVWTFINLDKGKKRGFCQTE